MSAVPPPLKFDQQLDTLGLSCPMPLLKMKLQLKQLQVGQVLYIVASDQGSWQDFAKFCQITEHQLIDAQQHDNIYHYWIQKGS